MRGCRIGLPVLIALSWLLGLARGWTAALAGDPQGVYFVVAQQLQAGDGLAAFASLWYGAGRMPGLPLAIALAAFATDDLTRAAQVVNIGLALLGLALVLDSARVLRLSRSATGTAFVIVATHVVFVSSALDALPDMGAMTATLLVLRLTFVESGNAMSSSRALAAGVVAGCGFLFRFNALALVAATPVAVAWAAPPRSRGHALGSAILGCSLMALPIAIIALGLARLGINYPNVYITPENISATQHVGPWVALSSALRGLSALPHRFGMAIGLPVALAGIPTLGVLALTRSVARPPLLILLAMLGLIAPLHFEARYYLFLLPPAVLGFVLALSNGLERLGPSWASLVGLGVAGAVIGGTNARESVALAKHAREHARDLRALCEALEAHAPGHSPVILGVEPSTYRYAHVRHCPSAQVEPSRFLASPGTPRDFGVSLYVHPADVPPLDGPTPIFEGAGFRAYRIDPIELDDGEGRVEGEGRSILSWTIALPRRPGHACEKRRVTFEPGEDTLELTVRSTPPLIAELGVEAGDTRKVFRGAGAAGMRGHLAVGTSSIAWLSLCAGDPLRAKGQVSVELRAAKREVNSQASIPR